MDRRDQCSEESECEGDIRGALRVHILGLDNAYLGGQKEARDPQD
jgi:hypothetical protein